MNGRRLAAPALAALVLLAGCGDDDAPESAGATTAGVPEATDGVGAPPPSTSVDGSTTLGQGDGPGASTTTAATGDGASPQPPPTLDGTGRVGSFAAALLRPDLSQRLVIELHVDGDAEPRGATLDHLADTLGDVSGKPVAVASASAPGGGTREWTASDLAAAADSGAVTAQGDGVAVVRLLFVHGTFEGDDGVLGVAVRGDLAAVFVDRVEAAGGLLGGSEGIEVSVATHELGHLLGLVDLVVDTGRADPEHPGHSTNSGSVMYWAVESDVVGQLLGANPPRDFDDADRTDLATIAGG